MKRLAACLVSSLLFVACAKDGPGPGPGPAPGPRACTEIGCMNGLSVALDKATPWAAGDYTFVVDVEGTRVTCEGALPLKPCDAGPSLRCDPPERVTIGESGCALGPETHGFSELQFVGGEPPRAVELTITRDGEALHTAKLSPTYTTSRPNGPECPPVCTQAREAVKIP